MQMETFAVILSASQIFLLRKSQKSQTRSQQYLKLSSDLSSLQTKVNISKDLNMSSKISHQIYSNTNYFTSSIYINFTPSYSMYFNCCFICFYFAILKGTLKLIL